MIDNLINNFLKFSPLSSPEKEAIIESVEIKEFKKGDFLLKEGQKSIHNVNQGLSAQLYLKRDLILT